MPVRKPFALRRSASRPTAPARRSDSASLRAFFAVWPDAAASVALRALADDVANRMSGRAAQASNLHLTIAFVGEIPEVRADLLSSIGVQAAADTAPFVLRLDRVATFRGSGIVWAGTTSTPPAIETLARLVREGLALQRFAVEDRAFHPHVTLARRCRRWEELAISPPIEWTVTRLVLNVSLLSSGPPRYPELGAWPLGPRAADDVKPT